MDLGKFTGIRIAPSHRTLIKVTVCEDRKQNRGGRRIKNSWEIMEQIGEIFAIEHRIDFAEKVPWKSVARALTGSLKPVYMSRHQVHLEIPAKISCPKELASVKMRGAPGKKLNIHEEVYVLNERTMRLTQHKHGPQHALSGTGSADTEGTIHITILSPNESSREDALKRQHQAWATHFGSTNRDTWKTLPRGERPDTLVVSGLPLRWFSVDGKIETSETSVVMYFTQSFGPVLRHRVVKDDSRTPEALRKVGVVLHVEVRLMFDHVDDFVRAFDTLYGRCLEFDGGQSSRAKGTAEIEVLWDVDGTLSDAALEDERRIREEEEMRERLRKEREERKRLAQERAEERRRLREQEHLEREARRMEQKRLDEEKRRREREEEDRRLAEEEEERRRIKREVLRAQELKIMRERESRRTAELRAVRIVTLKTLVNLLMEEQHQIVAIRNQLRQRQTRQITKQQQDKQPEQSSRNQAMQQSTHYRREKRKRTQSATDEYEEELGVLEPPTASASELPVFTLIEQLRDLRQRGGRLQSTDHAALYGSRTVVSAVIVPPRSRFRIS
eukprot:Clim_evm6s237 gene=Clim_evmTU6s237